MPCQNKISGTYFPGFCPLLLSLTRSCDLEQVTALNCTTGSFSGQIDLAWDAVDGARSYNIEISSDGGNNWAHLSSCTKARHTATGLASEAKAWFRVAAVGTKGQGPWSRSAKGTTGE